MIIVCLWQHKHNWVFLWFVARRFPEFSQLHPLILCILCVKEILLPFIYFKLPTWPRRHMEIMYCAVVLCFVGFYL